MRTVAYIRVSTVGQAVDGVSLEAQREKVELFTRLHDLDLVAVVEDAGASAKTLDRPGLVRALAMLEAGQADALLVCKLDRLTRSVRDLGYLIETHFGTNGHALMSISESVDTRTAAGRLVLNVLTSVAQWERETTVERTKDAMSHLKSQGKRVGSVPFGFKVAEDNQLVPDPQEQEALAIMRRLRAAGYSLRDIAAHLEENGYTPRGARWQPKTIARALEA
jgi:site-specific DNA recombinase